MPKYIAAMALLIAAAGGLVVSDAQYAYSCTTATGPIVLDGVADEAAWGNADSIQLSLNNGAIQKDMQDGVISQAQMGQYLLYWRNKPVYAKMLWNSAGLYVYFYGYHTQVWNERSGDDAVGYYDENAFELFLDPGEDGKDMIELNVSTRGDITDILNYDPMAPNYTFDLEGIEAVTKVEGTQCDDIGATACNQDQDQGWGLELMIPFSESFTMSEVASPSHKYWDDTLAVMQGRMPPAITAEGVKDWDMIAGIIGSGQPEAIAGMLTAGLDESTVSSIQGGTMTEGDKEAVLAALNALVSDVTLFVDNADQVTMRDTAYGLSPVSRKARGDAEAVVDYGGEVDLAYPLTVNDTNATVEWVNDRAGRATAVETVFVEGCSVVDTVVTTYPDTVIIEADGIAGQLHHLLVKDSVLLRDETTGEYSLASSLEPGDSIALAWLNYGLIEGLLLPGAVAQLEAIRNAQMRSIDIMGDLSMPPADGEHWGMNVYYMATPACSLYHFSFAWANVQETGNSPHTFDSFGTIAFVGEPEMSARRRAATMAGARGFRAAVRDRNRIAVWYRVPKDAARVRLELFSPSGALVQATPLAARAGSHAVSVDGRGLGAGAYIVRLEVDGAPAAGGKIILR